MSQRGRKWFSVLIAMERQFVSKPGAADLIEVKLIVTKAKTDDEAREQGEAAGRSAFEEYENQYGDVIRWSFREVLDVKEVSDPAIRNGSEVYYSFLSAEELDRLRAMLQSKLEI